MGLLADWVTDDGRARRFSVAVAGVLGTIVLLAAIDVIGDLAEGTTLGHVLIEAIVILTGLVGLVFTGRYLAFLQGQERALRAQAEGLAQQLRATAAEAARWRNESREILAGLGSAIDRQFVRWQLTAAEKEVALLLLKGLSHKEVAEVRGVNEATVRQQARAVYKKAAVSGRAELSAFFLEDLLLPPSDVPGHSPAERP